MSLLLLGFLIGLRHALEADHVAAVAALIGHGHSVKSAARLGAVWGIGHTATLFAVGTAAVLLDSVVPESFATWLEIAVGVMLIALGLDVFRRMIRDRIHFHAHRHDDGTEHFHAHAHRNHAPHAADPHRHRHEGRFPYRVLLVGLIHGMAGSAALILLALTSVESVWQAMIYMFLFGLGSILGMAVLSIVISIPLRASARALTGLHNGVQVALGLVTVGLGAVLVLERI